MSRLWLLLQTLMMTVSFGLLVFGAFFAWRNYRCQTDRALHVDVDGLRTAMKENVFGQDLAAEIILREVESFADDSRRAVTETTSPSPPPVLVLVLAGWLGGGKTYTTSLIRAAFPSRENVHVFSVPLHFAKETENFGFLEDLSSHLSRTCGHSLVVFDDVDGGSARAADRIERFAASLARCLSDPRNSGLSNGTVVVLTSNAGGRVINQHVLDVLRSGGRRADITAADLAASLQEHEIEMPGRRSSSAESTADGVKTVVVPFLPLTRDHVRQCILKEVREQGLSASSKEVDRILAEVGFFSQDFPALSKTGCKQIAGKVDLILGGQDPYLMIG